MNIDSSPSPRDLQHPNGREVMQRCDRLARFSSDPEKLTRLYLTPEHRQAANAVITWMEQAGMSATMDAIGNVVGRYEATLPGQPALLLGSHIDSVRDAGKYDGILGVIGAIACVQALHDAGERLSFAIEVIAFGDEEGVRFPTSMAGSRSLAGNFNIADLEQCDGDGVSLRSALIEFGLDPDAVSELPRARDSVLGYVELHIEQGPVLEAAGHALGVVTAIAGANRLTVTMTGFAGHAGTVPMSGRHDALTAAAEAILAVEARCSGKSADLVGTVGDLRVSPGASNVIPSTVRFSLDIRAATDRARQEATADIMREIEEIGHRREIAVEFASPRDISACACSPFLSQQLESAVARQGEIVYRLSSGAMHDAMQMASLTDVAMLFVRCRNGVSHNPTEAITVEDADLAVRVLHDFVRSFVPRGN